LPPGAEGDGRPGLRRAASSGNVLMKKNKYYNKLRMDNLLSLSADCR